MPKVQYRTQCRPGPRLRRLLLATLVFITSGSVLAQDGLGPGRRPKSPNICMNLPEMEAEAIVRAGMIIRDHARACGRRGMDAGITQMWGAFDGANTEKLQEAVRVRADAFKRNWPDDPYAAQRSANDTVASRQLLDFSPVECITLRDLVGGFKEWDDFFKHVRSTELGQVKTMYKLCPKGVRGPRGY